MGRHGVFGLYYFRFWMPYKRAAVHPRLPFCDFSCQRTARTMILRATPFLASRHVTQCQCPAPEGLYFELPSIRDTRLTGALIEALHAAIGSSVSTHGRSRGARLP
jgi:hypothetical protein